MVKGGLVKFTVSILSKPIIDMSSGTLYPLSCKARSAPIAIGSLAAKIAVGKF